MYQDILTNIIIIISPHSPDFPGWGRHRYEAAFPACFYSLLLTLGIFTSWGTKNNNNNISVEP